MRQVALNVLEGYYNTTYMLRPVSARLVTEYKEAMEKGVVFPPIVIGDFPAKESGKSQLMIDGMHRFRAALEAKLSKLPVETIHYDSEAQALADQLKRNMTHGQRVDPEHRDARIRQLVEVFRWKVRQVAKEVGLHHSSVSRIVRHKQQAGKPGPKGAMGSHPAQPTRLSPRKFAKEMDDIRLTITNGGTKQQLIAYLYDAKVSKGDRVTMLNRWQTVGTELIQFVQHHLPAMAEEGKQAVA